MNCCESCRPWDDCEGCSQNVREHRFRAAAHREICAVAHGPSHPDGGLMAPMTTSVLRKDGVPERTMGLPKQTRPTVWQNAGAHGPFHGREAQGGKVGMPAVEVWGTRGREFV